MTSATPSARPLVSPAAGELALGPAAAARREGATAQAVRRAQAVFVEEWDEALLLELLGGPRGRAAVLLTVVESLGHALRSWVVNGHEPAAVGRYYRVGELAVEHARAAGLVDTFREGYERQTQVGGVSGAAGQE